MGKEIMIPLWGMRLGWMAAVEWETLGKGK